MTDVMTTTKTPDYDALFATHETDHDEDWFSCSICSPQFVFAAPEPVVAPITDAEARGLADSYDRVKASRPSSPSGKCRRCDSYCYGDCTVDY